MKMRRFRIQHNIMAMNAYRNYNNTYALSGAVKIYAQNCLQAPAE